MRKYSSNHILKVYKALNQSVVKNIKSISFQNMPGRNVSQDPERTLDQRPYEDPGPYEDLGPYKDPGLMEDSGPYEDPGP